VFVFVSWDSILGIPLADSVFICAFDNFVRIMASRVCVVWMVVWRRQIMEMVEERGEEPARRLGGQLEIWAQGEIYIYTYTFQGAEDDMTRSWPTSKRVSWEGGAEDVLPRNENR
jgi:hypothetical protein